MAFEIRWCERSCLFVQAPLSVSFTLIATSPFRQTREIKTRIKRQLEKFDVIVLENYERKITAGFSQVLFVPPPLVFLRASGVEERMGDDDSLQSFMTVSMHLVARGCLYRAGILERQLWSRRPLTYTKTTLCAG